MAKLSLQRLLGVAIGGGGLRRQHRGKAGQHHGSRPKRNKPMRSGGAFPTLPPLPITDVEPDFEAPPSSYNHLQQDCSHGMWYNNSNDEDSSIAGNEDLERRAVDVEDLRTQGEKLLTDLGTNVKKDRLRKEAEGLLDGLEDQIKNLKQKQREAHFGVYEDSHEADLLLESSPFITYYRHELQRLRWSIADLNRWGGGGAGGDEGDPDGAEYQAFLSFYYKDVMPLVVKAGDRDHFPVSGNIYMYMALKDFGRSSGLIQTSRAASSSRMQWVRMGGFLVIALLQIFAPFAIMVYAASPLQVNYQIDGKLDFFPWFKNDPDWGFSFQSQRILGILFLFLFVLNGLFVLRSDLEETKKMMFMCKVFQDVAVKNDDWDVPQPKWLWVGSFINVLCLISCSICMFFLFIMAAGDKGPKDIVFDSLGLAFLYNLDDVGGDLTLLDEEWDEDMIGDIYGGLADNMPAMTRLEETKRNSRFTPDNIYQIGELLAMFLLVALPLMFAFVHDITPKSPDSTPPQATEIAELKASVFRMTEAMKAHGISW